MNHYVFVKNRTCCVKHSIRW